MTYKIAKNNKTTTGTKYNEQRNKIEQLEQNTTNNETKTTTSKVQQHRLKKQNNNKTNKNKTVT